MRGPRLIRFGAALLGLAGLLLAAGFAGAMACSLPSLPGDGLWNLRREALEGLAAFSGAPALCLSGSAAGAALLRLAAWSPQILMGAVLLALLWETLGRRLRLALWRARGGQALLMGSASRLDELSRTQHRLGPVAFFAPSDAEATALARAHPFAEIGRLPAKPRLPAFLTRLGAPRARMIAAASEQDYLNLDVMDAVLHLPGLAAKELLLRLEDAETRAEFAGRFRQLAMARGMTLAVPSLLRGQLRDGAAAAAPGHFMRAGQPQHVALIGSGPLLQPLAFHLARQGYGLEEAVPILSIIRTGREDFASGALERLTAAHDAIQIRPAFADGTNAALLDRAIAAVAGGELLSAVHCAESEPPRALARAQRFEAMLMRLNRPVPPIVAYCEGPARCGDSGMIGCVPEGNLARYQAEALRRDAHAMALHEAYLRDQRQARGAAFGGLASEVPWAELPEPLKDDNRAVADHLDYKLARIGFTLARGDGASDDITPAEIEHLARIEHARWMAAKIVDGWRYGEQRDDTRMLHPSLIPYEQLSDSEKAKDRAVIRETVGRLSSGGWRLCRAEPGQ